MDFPCYMKSCVSGNVYKMTDPRSGTVIISDCSDKIGSTKSAIPVGNLSPCEKDGSPIKESVKQPLKNKIETYKFRGAIDFHKLQAEMMKDGNKAFIVVDRDIAFFGFIPIKGINEIVPDIIGFTKLRPTGGGKGPFTIYQFNRQSIPDIIKAAKAIKKLHTDREEAEINQNHKRVLVF